MRRLVNHHVKINRIAKAARPPTTPPTIAPTLILDEDEPEPAATVAVWVLEDVVEEVTDWDVAWDVVDVTGGAVTARKSMKMRLPASAGRPTSVCDMFGRVGDW